MPFTLAHPVAVIPLLHRGRGRGMLVGSGLVFGAMAPDVPYFAGEFALGDLAHRWWAVPTLDLALTTALVAAWHLVLRAPLVGLLPGRWSAAAEQLTAPRERALRPARVGWFALSAVIGAATHIFWDSFTHPDRFGVRLVPALQDARVLGEPPYVLLQYGCSVLGCAVLGVWAVRELRRAAGAGAHPTPPTGNRRMALTLTTTAAVAGATYRYAGWARPGMPWTSLLPVLAFGAVAGAAVALVLYALLTTLASRRLRRSPA